MRLFRMDGREVTSVDMLRHHVELAVSTGGEFKPRHINIDPDTSQMLRHGQNSPRSLAAKKATNQAGSAPLGRCRRAENTAPSTTQAAETGKEKVLTRASARVEKKLLSVAAGGGCRPAQEEPAGTGSSPVRKRRVSGYGWQH